MSRTWEDAPTRIQEPLYRPRHEPRPPLERRVLAWHLRRAAAGAVAMWLVVALLVLVLLILAPITWHGLSPWLTGGHP